MTLETPPLKKPRIANSAYRFLPERWRQKNILYYKDTESLYQFYVRPNSKVLEIGSGTGYLLASVNIMDIQEKKILQEKSINRRPWETARFLSY